MDRYTDFLRVGTGRQKVDGHERDLAPFDTEGFGRHRRRRVRGHPHLGGPDRPRAGQARLLARLPLCRGTPGVPCGPVPHRREPRRERAGHPPGGHLAAPSVRRYLAPSVRRGGSGWARCADPAVRRLASAPGLRRPGSAAGVAEEAGPGRGHGRGVRHRGRAGRRRPRPLRVALDHDQRGIQSQCAGARWQRVPGRRFVAVRVGVVGRRAPHPSARVPGRRGTPRPERGPRRTSRPSPPRSLPIWSTSTPI